MIFFFYVILISNKAFLKSELLRLYHNDALTKHFKIKKTRTFMNEKFYWSKMIVDINEYIKDCDIYQQNKTFRHRLYNELTFFFISIRSWIEISMNFITKLLVNRCENDVFNDILIIINRYFKMSLYILVKFVWTTKDLIDILFEKVLLVYFDIREIVFDRKSLFINDYWSTIYYCIRVKQKFSIAFQS